MDAATIAPPGRPKARFAPPLGGRGKSVAAKARAWGSSLRRRYHVVDGGLHVCIGERRIAALWRHHAAFALETLDRVCIERVIAFRDSCGPRRFVAKLRRARNAGTMTGDAGRVVDLLAVGFRCSCRGWRRSRRR